MSNVSPDDFSQLVRSRRSIRDFKPDPIPAELLQKVLDDAKWGPSWTNTQPYFLAVASGATRDRLQHRYLELFDASVPVQQKQRFAKLKMFLTRRGMPNGDYKTTVPYPEELQQYRRATGHGLYAALGIDRSDRKSRDEWWRRNFEFFGAPTVMFLFVHEGLEPFSAQDGGIFLQTLMLSAHANGLGTCAQGVLATWASPVRAEFDVPPNYKLISGLSIGYPSEHIVNQFSPGRRAADVQIRD